MLGNGIEMSLIFGQTLGPSVLGWAPNHFVLGAHLAPGVKRLVCIPGAHNFFKIQYPLWKATFSLDKLEFKSLYGVNSPKCVCLCELSEVHLLVQTGHQWRVCNKNSFFLFLS